MKSIPPELFKNHVQKIRNRIVKLESLEIPPPQKFVIDWNIIKNISEKSNRNKWQDLPIYKELLSKRKLPAVYYFIITKGNSELLFEQFAKVKRYHSDIRLNKSVRDKSFKNISSVPKKYFDTDCLYVGSRKSDIHQRLIQHLGFGSGRTGAMHLFSVLGKQKAKFEIVFYCHFLNEGLKDVTTDIEAALQAHLQPFIGKNILGD
jgi:hypothetical protein